MFLFDQPRKCTRLKQHNNLQKKLKPLVLPPALGSMRSSCLDRTPLSRAPKSVLYFNKKKTNASLNKNCLNHCTVVAAVNFPKQITASKKLGKSETNQ